MATETASSNEAPVCLEKGALTETVIPEEDLTTDTIHGAAVTSAAHLVAAASVVANGAAPVTTPRDEAVTRAAATEREVENEAVMATGAVIEAERGVDNVADKITEVPTIEAALPEVAVAVAHQPMAAALDHSPPLSGPPPSTLEDRSCEVSMLCPCSESQAPSRGPHSRPTSDVTLLLTRVR